jgi:hypothetical protein
LAEDDQRRERGVAGLRRRQGTHRNLPGIDPMTLLWHSRSHAAIAVDAGDRWVLHARDSSGRAGPFDGRRGYPTAELKQFALDANYAQVRFSLARRRMKVASSSLIGG